jgi:probable rRNA maturation factor
MIEIVFSNEHEFPLSQAGIEQAIARVFLIHNIDIAQIGVQIVDEEQMTVLNEQYKHHQGATDVLTFVLHDPEQPTPHFVETTDSSAEYGDVFLCFPVIAASAVEEGVTVQERAEFLAEHGALHLLGEHHD